MQIEGKTVLVVGTGKSGIAATELLISKGIDTAIEEIKGDFYKAHKQQ